MIRLEQVYKRYGDKLAVDDLSLEVGRGEVCVLIGPSGCGKTTTLRLVNRLIEPTAGHVYIEDRDITFIKPEKLRQSIGYAIQSVGLFPHMTVAQNISVVPELLHWDKSRFASRVEELLRLVGLDPVEDALKYPAELSGGEAQRVGVARALAADPPILLMDEPFGAVDPLTRIRLQSQFINIQHKLKKTVILVTHDLDEAIQLADRIAIMNAGKLVQYDTPETILRQPVNKFVHDFVGTDRALKRLSRMSVKSFIRTSNPVKISASLDELVVVCNGCRWAWITSESGILRGWVDTRNAAQASSIADIMVSGNPAEIAINVNATLREALSRMLGQGFRTMPVVNENGLFLGEIELADIESALTGESQ